MRICLVRHGKPIMESGSSLNASGFTQWLREFDSSGIDPWARPTDEGRQLACGCKAVVTSPLERAHASARLLFPDRSVLVEPRLRECGLPAPPLPFVKLSPEAWVSLCRTLWFMGYSKGTESVAEARARAVKGAEILVRIAAYNDSVAFVGHGLINAFIARELRQSGWQGPSIPGRNYWDVTVYRSSLQPIKGREALKGSRVRVPKPETV